MSTISASLFGFKQPGFENGQILTFDFCVGGSRYFSYQILRGLLYLHSWGLILCLKSNWHSPILPSGQWKFQDDGARTVSSSFRMVRCQRGAPGFEAREHPGAPVADPGVAG